MVCSVSFGGVDHEDLLWVKCSAPRPTAPCEVIATGSTIIFLFLFGFTYNGDEPGSLRGICIVDFDGEVIVLVDLSFRGVLIGLEVKICLLVEGGRLSGVWLDGISSLLDRLGVSRRVLDCKAVWTVGANVDDPPAAALDLVCLDTGVDSSSSS